MSKTSLRIIQESQNTIISLEGNWSFQTNSKDLYLLKDSLKNASTPLIIDFQKVVHLDFVFASFLIDFLESLHLKPELINVSEKMKKILKKFYIYADRQDSPQKSFQFWGVSNVFEHMGKFLCGLYQKTLDFLNFSGMTHYFFIQTLMHPFKIRLSALLYHINESGFKALPVSILTAFIVGYAITLQGAMQLQSMGAPLMSIDTTAKLSLREMGPFILALVIAGRSASSFTAQIGVMKLTEELDAMRTMSFNPFWFLVIPRVMALVIVMPLLVFLADGFALFGGMIAIKYQLGISFSQYIARFYDTVNLSHFWVGLIKAPFFGWAIAMVGCFRGFEVRGDTESVGRLTTISVVNALFWIIFINAIFSIIFTKLGV